MLVPHTFMPYLIPCLVLCYVPHTPVPCCAVCLQASAWRETDGTQTAPWTAVPDVHRKAHRIREIEAGILRCKALVQPKLREQVRHRARAYLGPRACATWCFEPRT